MSNLTNSRVSERTGLRLYRAAKESLIGGIDKFLLSVRRIAYPGILILSFVIWGIVSFFSPDLFTEKLLIVGLIFFSLFMLKTLNQGQGRTY